jgi:PAS domain S-box-containing protein
MKRKTAEKTPLKVLYLENSPQDVETIRELLIESGYDLILDCTEKKREYVSLLRNRPYDVILSDFKLPGFDAFGALKLSKETCPEVPFICISGSIGEETASDLIKQGAVDYVLKGRLVRLPLAIKRALDEVKERGSRRRAEEALRESEDRFRSLFDSSMDGILLTAPTGEIFSANPAACKMLNRSEEEICLLGRNSVVDVTDPRLADSLEERARTGRFSGELTLMRKDGSKFPAEVSSVIFKDKKGFDHTSMIIKDITERKRAEEVLRENENRMRTIVEGTPHLFFYTQDVQGKITYVSPSVETITGHSVDEWHSQPDWFITKNKINDYARELTQTHLRGEFTKGPILLEVEHADQRPILLEIYEDPIVTEGKTTGLRGVAHDVTERKQAQEALTRSEERYRLLYQYAPVGILLADRSGQILEVNPEALQILGSPSAEATKGVNMMTFPPLIEAGISAAYQRCVETGQSSFGEYPYTSKWGKTVHIQVRFVPIHDDHNQATMVHIIIEDVTERKDAEIALRESQQMLRTVLDTVPARVFWKDKNGVFLGCNFPFAKDSGFSSSEDIVGKDDFQMGWREQAELYRADDRQVIESDIPKIAYEEPQSYETGVRWLRTSKVPLRNAKGEVIGVLGTYEDVTEAKQAALQLAYERYLLNALLENTVDSIYFKDIEGRFTRVSATTVAKRGLTGVDQLLGKTDFDFFTKERAQEMYEQEQEIIRTHKPVVDVEVQELWADRPPTWASVTKVPLHDQAGKITGLFGISRNITDRKNAEIALRESEEKFRGLVEGSASAIWIHDAKRFLYLNPAALEMTGYTAEELYRVAPSEIVHPDFRESVVKRAEERIEGKDVPKHYEYQIMKKSGEAIWIDFSGAAIDYQGKPAIIALAYDISDRKKLEEQLIQAQKMEGIGTLAGGVAHDYNNILAVIIGCSDLIMMKMNKADQAYRYVETIASAAKRGADITKQLLAFARRGIFSPRVLDPNKVIKSLQEMLQRLIGENIDLMFLPEKNVWNVKIDPTQLDQILVNLATNARDAIDDVGAITIETSNVSIDGGYARNHIDFSPGEYVMISFTDTGKGMSKETLERIFEPFFTTKSKGQGTGLGLSTVYGIVKQNGGSINVYSEKDMGTTFKIYLPHHQGEVEEPEAVQVEEPASGTETVLIVEDQADLLELAKNSLEEYGYGVLTASGPGEGIQLCERYQGKIHLLLTDVVMPVMNGKELRDKILTIKPDIRTIFMSGYAANVIAHRGVLDEEVDFIQKPFTPYALAKKVHDVLKS